MTTDTIMLTIALLFFSFMTLYNLKIAIREKKDYVPAIVGFLFTLIVALVLFQQMFYAIMGMAIITVISTVYLIKRLLEYIKNKKRNI